jgi:hypothetical protein
MDDAFLSFEPISLEQQARYLSIFSRMPQKSSDYSFINLWGWADVYGLQWAWDEHLVWIRQTKPQQMYWAPVGPWEDIDWSLYFNRDPKPDWKVTRIPEVLLYQWKDHLKQRFEVIEERDQWDYIYLVSNLSELKGNRFHKKRNLLNQFIKKYDFKFITLGLEWMDLALEMQENWCIWRDCESIETLGAENRVIENIFQHWEDLEGIFGGGLLIEDRMVAYTVGERISSNTLLIHFEKGNPDYIGVYQAMNQIFTNQVENGLIYVNREQDLGDAGLRKAKLSYHPVEFIRKYRIHAV